MKANPLKLLEKYFDAFVYLANWGTREFYLRLPQQLVKYTQIRSFVSGEAAQIRRAGEHLIVGFESESEGDDFDDGTGWVGLLMPLRSELLRGDLRCLYLGWLLCVQCGEFSEKELEPTVPAGLGQLSAPLHSLIEFLRSDEDLVEVAASGSAPMGAVLSREQLAAWIRSLTANEKDDLLETALSETAEVWRNELMRRFRQHAFRGAEPTATTRRRTVRGPIGSSQRSRTGSSPANRGKASSGSGAAKRGRRGRTCAVSGPTGEIRGCHLE
ncbi:MAG TPA: hypothetical protein VEV41_17725 [Terriglobales bacterium]|nr:hypothetical protein [Terriglobales bacterium]